jgi:hypothetical protein
VMAFTDDGIENLKNLCVFRGIVSTDFTAS